MRRGVLTAVFSVLMLAGAVAWIHSYTPRSSLSGLLHNSGWWIASGSSDGVAFDVAGHLGLVSVELAYPLYEGPADQRIERTARIINCLGARYLQERLTVYDSRRTLSVDEVVFHEVIDRMQCRVEIPCWMLIALLAAYPFSVFLRGPVRRFRRRRRGLCVDCGYDLTGNVSHTYPECGVPL